MKPKEKKPETIFRIIDRATGEAQGAYSRACCDEFDFASPEEARSANVHNAFQDRHKYKIAQYRVTYELINDDCDGPAPAENENTNEWNPDEWLREIKSALRDIKEGVPLKNPEFMDSLLKLTLLTYSPDCELTD